MRNKLLTNDLTYWSLKYRLLPLSMITSRMHLNVHSNSLNVTALHYSRLDSETACWHHPHWHCSSMSVALCWFYTTVTCNELTLGQTESSYLVLTPEIETDSQWSEGAVASLLSAPDLSGIGFTVSTFSSGFLQHTPLLSTSHPQVAELDVSDDYKYMKTKDKTKI